MTARDLDTILAAWLDEGPTDLPDVTRRAIVGALPTTTQARRGPLAPWRFNLMTTYGRLAAAAIVAVIAIGGTLLVIGPRLGVGPSATPSPTPAATGPVAAGRITLTDTGCTWEGNPGTLPTGATALSFEIRNQTDDYGAFFLHWVRPGHTWEEGVAFVEELQRRLATGEDWPENDISQSVRDIGVNAGATVPVRWGGSPLEPGTYGVICSANTSAFGDVLTTFLVGPLNMGPPPSGGLSAGTGSAVDTAQWLPFSSGRHGYDARQPAGHLLTAATKPLMFDFLAAQEGKEFLGGDLRFVAVFDDMYDTLHASDALYPVIGATSSRLPDGMSEAAWLATYGRADDGIGGRSCIPAESERQAVVVDGISGRFYASECGFHEVLVFAGGRAYTFSVTRGMGGPGSEADVALLLAFVSTVTLRPETANDKP